MSDHSADPLHSRILVIDDDAGLRFLLRESLEQAGFIIDEVDNGVEAPTRFASFRPDIVLLDIQMPGVDGFAVCQSLRRLPGGAHTPIVMLTGLDDVASIDRAYDAGATDFVTKPINYRILTQRMRYMSRAKQTADDLRESRRKLASAHRIARVGYWEWEANDREMTFSESLAEMFGFGSSMAFNDFLSRVCADDRDLVSDRIQTACEEKAGFSVEFRIHESSARYAFVQMEAEYDVVIGGQDRLAGTLQDVTERKTVEDRIRYLAYFDNVTGLPNRTFFKELLAKSLSHARTHDRCVALLFLDLDSFKRINDTMGHSVGDTLLRQVAYRLSRTIRSRGMPAPGAERIDGDMISFVYREISTVSRLGGDEFVIMLNDLSAPEDAIQIADRVRDALASPFTLNGAAVVVTASIGISVYPDSGENAEELLRAADAAMYHSKARGAAGYELYSVDLNRDVAERFSIETELRRALDREELSLVFQPKVSVQDGTVVGAEALLRWERADGRPVPPSEFVPIAEEVGLIVPLGEWVLRHACAEIRRMRDAGLRDLRVSVNLSPMQVGRENFLSTIENALSEHDVDPRALEVEITERIVMDDSQHVVDALRALHALGVTVSIDDFGVGYSSLSYLRRFPFHALKIDRSFVSGLAESSDNRAIVTATIALAHSLNLRVVAEGVEKETELTILRELGCDEAQGYFWSAALSVEAFLDWALAGERAGVSR